MTLLTDTTPAAAAPGGTPAAAATPAPAAAPSSGVAKPAAGEQPATGKEPTTPTKPTAEPKGKDKGDDGPGEKKAPAGAPESYSFKAPEGYQVGAHAEKALTEVARELNLSNDAAQAIMDKMSPALKAQTLDNIDSMVNGWINDSRNDPEIGGDKLRETIAYGQKALDLGPPELRQLLGPVSQGGTGLGNHPAILKWAAAIGRKVSPDAKVVSGNQPAPPPKSAMERLAETYEKTPGS